MFDFFEWGRITENTMCKKGIENIGNKNAK